MRVGRKGFPVVPYVRSSMKKEQLGNRIAIWFQAADGAFRSEAALTLPDYRAARGFQVDCQATVAKLDSDFSNFMVAFGPSTLQ